MVNIIFFHLSNMCLEMQRYIWEFLNVPDIVYFSMVSTEFRRLCIEINEKVNRQFIFNFGQSIRNNRIDINIKIKKIQTAYNHLSQVLILFPLINKIEFKPSFPNHIELDNDEFHYHSHLFGKSLHSFYNSLQLQKTLLTFKCSYSENSHIDGLSKLICLTKLDISFSVQLTSFAIYQICKLKQLSYLNLRGCEDALTTAGLKQISLNLTNLKFLDISSNDNITNEGISYFSHLVHLKHLSLSGCNKISDDGLSYISSLSSLVGLDIAYIGLTDNCLHFLSKLNNISKFNIISTRISTQGLLYISTIMKNLKQFLCSHLIDDTSMLHISYFNNLTSLDILAGHSNSFISQNSFTNLFLLTQLSKLYLSTTKTITDQSFSNIANLTNLKDLQLNCLPNITDFGISYLAKLKNLELLIINKFRNITGDSLSSIALLTKLTSLKISNCNNIYDIGLSQLEVLTNLSHLDLHGTSVSDNGLFYLKKLVNLTALDLQLCPLIMGDGFYSLSSLKKLKFLDLSGNNNLTKYTLIYFLQSSSLEVICIQPMNLEQEEYSKFRFRIDETMEDFDAVINLNEM